MNIPADAVVTRSRARELLDLPDEILTSIFSQMVKDSSWCRRDILNFRLTCRRFHEGSEFPLYRNISIGSAPAYECLLRSLSACFQRRNYVQHFILNLYWVPHDDRNKFSQKTDCVINFTNMESLDIRLQITPKLGTQDWLGQLQYQLNSDHFSRLREASLNLIYSLGDARKCTFQIRALLQAPALRKLSLLGLDLREARAENLPEYETCLEELYLGYCQITETSLAAILAVPATLASFKFAAGNSDNDTPRSRPPVRRELEILSHTITTLAAKQRYLTKFAICLWPRSSLSPGRNFLDINLSNVLDIGLSKLPPLDELCICAGRDGRFDRWFPMSPFFYLPVCEVLKLYVNLGTSSLEEIALSHLAVRRRTNAMEVSPRHLIIIDDDFQRPSAHERQQQKDEKLRRGIDMFMTHLQLEKLTYYQNRGDYPKLMLARLSESNANGEYLFEEKAYECDCYLQNKQLISHTSGVRELLPVLSGKESEVGLESVSDPESGSESD